MTKKEKAENELIISRGCWICQAPAEIHHVRRLATSKKRKRAPKLPLCYAHHNSGFYGVSIHAGREIWERKYGDEVKMAEEVYACFGIKWDF